MQDKTREKLAKFAWRLKAMAERRRLKQADVARALGIHWSVVGNWFQGRNYPRPEQMGPLCDLLKTNASWLYDGSESTEDSTDLQGTVEEDAAEYPALNKPNPTAEDCRKYLELYLEEARPIPALIAKAWTQLHLYLPIDEVRKLRRQMASRE